jgi:transcription antitermination factor NusG
MTERTEANWYAAYTRSRHEKQVEQILRRQALAVEIDAADVDRCD